MAVDSMAKANTPEPVGTGPLWKTPGLHLPPLIQHVANDLREKRGMSESQAIQVAVGVVKKWAAGIPTGGMKSIRPDTVAAAQKAVAQWEAAKAAAHATSHGGSESGLALGFWDSLLHPRAPAGSAGGGRFAPKGSGGAKGGGKGAKGKGGGAKGKAAKAAQAAQTKQALDSLSKMTPEQRAAALAKLTDPQVKALAAMAAQGNSEDPNVKAMRTAIADELAKRSLTGAKGPTQVNAAKAASAKAAAGRKSAAASKRAATAKAAAQRKAATAQKQKTAATARAQRQQATAARQQTAAAKRQQLTALRQQLAVTTDKARQGQLRMQIRRVLAGLPAVPPATPAVAASHTDGGSLALAVPSVTSGDGSAVTVNADQKRAWAKSGVAMPDGSFYIPNRRHVMKAVKALGRTSASKRPAVRAHIRKRARALGVPIPEGAK